MVPAVDIREMEGEAQIAQARVLWNEYGELLRERHGHQCLSEFHKEVAGLPGDYGRPAGAVLLAQVDGELAGCVGVRHAGREGQGRAAEMKRLYVRPVYRGMGIGRRLAEAAIEEARRLGYSSICLDTLPAMTEAISIYHSLGFRETIPYGVHPSGAVCLARLLG